jgi:hypothetical protein
MMSGVTHMHAVARLALAAFILSACASTRSVEVPASEFRNFGDSESKHTVYLGSDEMYHYFHWHDGRSGGNWKIGKAEMGLGFEFPVSEDRSTFVRKNAQGQWEPWANNPHTEGHAQ